MVSEILTEVKCYHCGLACEQTVWFQDKAFCCTGCKTVFEILSANNLCGYYSLDQLPGIKQQAISSTEFEYLDQKEIYKKIIEFDSKTFAKVRFYVPAIHCVSCIWLLENLRKIDEAIIRSEVNFSQKTVVIDFDPQQIKLSNVAALISSIGYTPQIALEKEKNKAPSNKTLVVKLSIAGFCFGNVMLFSFPEYLGLDNSDSQLKFVFSLLNLLLAIPVIGYSASDYFRSAIKSFKQKQINIDVPIAAGLAALFLRSSWDILSSSGPGYLDSLTGLVFFLLIGRWFQSKTYETLAFDRDFKSYFPLAVNKLVAGQWTPVIIYELQKKDQIKIRNMEIIPADSILLSPFAYIDYSFVTGESKPEKVTEGDLIYAGGRLIGQPILLEIQKETSQSHLTSLWNHEAFRKKGESRYQKIIDTAARKFTWIVLAIAFCTAIYWQIVQPDQMWLVLTSVLMVACPCALALAAPFTYGSMLRVFGRNQFYLKNADVIERIASINAVVFDKTGTLTKGHQSEVLFNGELNDNEKVWIKLLTSYSTHPLSRIISESIPARIKTEADYFSEIPNKGISGTIEGHSILIGTPAFVGFREKMLTTAYSTVFVSIDNEVRGHFSIHTIIRKDMHSMLKRLAFRCRALLSGDKDTDREKFESLFPSFAQLLFNQSPHDKLEYIAKLQSTGNSVMMIGDGLNDAGAMKQSDVGVAVTDDTGTFTPACDGILQGDQLKQLPQFIDLAKSSSMILKMAFGISFFYNAIALSFAVTGHLTPLVAAILMPISSISVVSFSSVAVNLVSKHKLKER